jgi:hypothetical protein
VKTVFTIASQLSIRVVSCSSSGPDIPDSITAHFVDAPLVYSTVFLAWADLSHHEA